MTGQGLSGHSVMYLSKSWKIKLYSAAIAVLLLVIAKLDPLGSYMVFNACCVGPCEYVEPPIWQSVYTNFMIVGIPLSLLVALSISIYDCMLFVIRRYGYL